jgi:2-haloacid dehalogenase
MRYPFVLLDLDHTLIDSATAEIDAFDLTLTSAGIKEPRQFLDTYLEINHALWSQVERGELQPNDVRSARFERFVAAVELDIDFMDLSDAYGIALAEQSRLFPEARAVLEHLSAGATLALVTNGLSDVQRSRISLLDLEQYFDAIVISSEIGHTKPGAAIFDHTFQALGSPDKGLALMVGDSLTSDIRGGACYGIDTCWFNPDSSTPDGVIPTFAIDRLAHLPNLVATGQLG